MARPQSTLGTACHALLATVQQVSTDVTKFVRRCRSARTDLASVTRELSKLQMVLQPLDNLEVQQRSAVPATLQAHLGPILSNCVAVVAKVQDVLRCQHGAGWTVEARNDVVELAKLLGVHRAVVGLASDLISVVVSRCGRSADDERAHMAVLLEELQALDLSLVISYSNAALAREHSALQVHLGQMVIYIETLARADPPLDAVKTIDETRHKANLDRLPQQPQQQPNDTRGSLSLPAPLLHRGHSADKHVEAAGIWNSRLGNLLQLGHPDVFDPNRPPSLFFSPNTNNQAQEMKSPPPPVEGAGPSGTGFIVMDGFVNSVHSGATIAPAMSSYGANEQNSRNLTVPEREPRPPSSQRSFECQNSATSSMYRPSSASLQSAPSRVQARASAAGLQMQIPCEKELAVEERISDEALAFAQVPIHVLDRLSVNLVEQIYGISPTDNPGHNHIVSQTSPATTSSNTWGPRDSHLQVSQMDPAEVPSAPPTPHFPSQATSWSRTPVAYHQQPLYISSAPQPPTPTPTSPNAANSQAAYDSTGLSTTLASFHPSRSRPSFTSVRSAPNLVSQNCSSPPVGHSRLREVESMSTMQTLRSTRPYDLSQKPLPRPPLVYIPGYPGPFIKKKVVVVGNFSCGKTCLITRMARGQYPMTKEDDMRITETIKLSVDETPMQISFWDIRGIDYDPSWLHNAHVALVCFSVNIASTDSKGKHLGRWVAEITRNCPGAAILLVGLKSDLRFHAKLARTGRALVTPEQGEQFRENIGAMRYVECSARTGEGVQALLGETARVAMQVRRLSEIRALAARNQGGGYGLGGGGGGAARGSWRGRNRPLSRIGKFFGFTGQDEGRK